jgi:hypothetical protein
MREEEEEDEDEESKTRKRVSDDAYLKRKAHVSDVIFDMQYVV